MICPNCWGDCDSDKIQLHEIEGDCQTYFYCKRCKHFFKLEELDEVDLSEEYIPMEIKAFKKNIGEKE